MTALPVIRGILGLLDRRLPSPDLPVLPVPPGQIQLSLDRQGQLVTRGQRGLVRTETQDRLGRRVIPVILDRPVPLPVPLARLGQREILVRLDRLTLRLPLRIQRRG